MPGFGALLLRNRNYRYTWMGQIVSEVGDHFNNIAVLSLAVEETHNGFAVAGLMLSRAIPAVSRVKVCACLTSSVSLAVKV